MSKPELDPPLHRHLLDLLTPLADGRVSAREAYEAMVPLLTRTEGDIPTGARLVACLHWFNAQRDPGLPAIPAGTSGVAQDCVTQFRRGLVAGLSEVGVHHPGLPADLQVGLNQWLEKLFVLLQQRLAHDHEAALDRIKSEHLAEKNQWEAESTRQIQVWQQACQETEQARAQAQTDCLTARERVFEQAQEIEKLETALASANQQTQVLQAALHAQTTEVALLNQQHAEAQRQCAQLQNAFDQQQRQFLLLQDQQRVQEQELVKEKERRKASEQMCRMLERQLTDSKNDNQGLRQSLQDWQTQWEHTQTEVHALSPAPGRPRLQAARRSASGPVPQKRKSLR